MPFHILSLDYQKNEQLERVFRSMNERNTILFLGAGSSVTDTKRYLSSDIIDFYEDKKRIKYQIDDITEFVDALSNTPGFSRDEFDNYVDECLRRLKPEEAHKILASVPWREIITTNYDLIVERAFQDVSGTPAENLKIYPIRSVKEVNYVQAADEVKYIKLNGCIYDKKKYRLIFSSEDFERSKRYYKEVLNGLKNLSDRITFLSIGYSYSDKFSKKLLDTIDGYDFRQKRVIYTVDPFIPDAVLPLYEAKKICVIKSSMSDFFAKYKEWEESKSEELRKTRRIVFSDAKNNSIKLPYQSLRRLDGNVLQLNGEYRSKIIADSDYYRGEEPNYNVILKHFDVVKKRKLADVKKIVDEYSSGTTRIIPIFFLTGSFGTGKSTFSYRLIHDLINNSDGIDTVALEITNPHEININDLNDLFNKILAERIILYSNTADLNSTFKSILDLRNKISTSKDLSEVVMIMCSIRENLLQVQQSDKEIKNSQVISVDCKLNREEIEELVERLKTASVIDYRDLEEKNRIIEDILYKYEGDSFLSLLELITNNKHIDDLIEAYDQIGKEAQEALLYTSLLYQYNISIPASLLKALVSKDWEEFRTKILPTQAKGLLLQEVKSTRGSDPDLFFKTKHPIISQKIVQQFLSNEEDRFDLFENIVKHLLNGSYSSRLIINLFKAIRYNGDLPHAKLNRLYDLAAKALAEEPNFLLHYAINLQSRGDEKSLTEAVDRIIYAESALLERRNHMLIHRRGVLYFELAKLNYEKDKNVSHKTLKFLNDAREMFLIKRQLDPCTPYGYYDAIRLEIWCLEKIQMNEVEELRTRIFIEEQLDTASRSVFENIDKINSIKFDYARNYKFNSNEREYIEYLRESIEDAESRPYALTLLFNHYLLKDNIQECESILPELEYFTYKKDVLQTLFKFYGRYLHVPDYRIKFYDLVRDNKDIEESDTLRYNYFRFVAAAYDRHFADAYQYSGQINDRFNYLNSDYRRAWIDSETGKDRIFEATIKKGGNNKFKAYLSYFSRDFPLLNFKESQYVFQKDYYVKLNFFLNGIFAVVVDIPPQDQNL